MLVVEIKKMKRKAMAIGILLCIIFLGCIVTIRHLFLGLYPPGLFYGVQRDYGPEMTYTGSGKLYEHSSVRLGDTRCYAWVGSFRVDEHAPPPWEEFLIRIYVEAPAIKVVGEGESRETQQTVTRADYFRRWIPREKVPMELWNKDVEDLVSYKKNGRVVTFDLGFTNYTYRLPRHSHSKHDVMTTIIVD